MSLFSPEKFMEDVIKNLPKEIDGPAIIAVSGVVDSTVAAAATAKAIGENPEADADGMGEPDGHERGKATSGERWLKANPKNQW